MIPAAFDYHAPRTLDEALALLARHRDDAKVLSGGQSLLPLLKLRLGGAAHLVDIGRIPDLEYVKEEGGWLAIGGRTREAELERSELIRRRYPLLADTAAVIADPLVRNLATVGGNLAHGDPANDHPAAMLALRAEVVAAGPRGRRTIPIDELFTGMFQTALEPDEILVEIRVPEPPAPPARSGGAYVKLERKVGDFATAASAVQVTLAAGGAGEAGGPGRAGGPGGAGGEVVTRAGIALTNAGAKPVRAAEAERFLAGKQPTEEVIAEAARLAAAAATPSADRRGKVEYKREMSRVLTARALRRAIQRAKES
jgi:carbon-monoxide dehydrogenase medium subunit